MIKLMKLNQRDDMKVYFTSDTHWNHNPKWKVPLWKARGYSSVDESNAHIINQINDIVGENDTLFHLGDLTLNCNEDEFERFISSLKCQYIYTLWGNHNSPAWKIYQREVSNIWVKNVSDENMSHQMFCDAPEVYPFRYKNVVFLGNYAEITVDGIYFVLCHYPIYVFNHMGNGALHLTGHSHGNLPLSQPTNTESKVLDVGWDLHKKPLSIKEITDIMYKKNVLKVDHHGEV